MHYNFKTHNAIAVIMTVIWIIVTMLLMPTMDPRPIENFIVKLLFVSPTSGVPYLIVIFGGAELYQKLTEPKLTQEIDTTIASDWYQNVDDLRDLSQLPRPEKIEHPIDNSLFKYTVNGQVHIIGDLLESDPLQRVTDRLINTISDHSRPHINTIFRDVVDIDATGMPIVSNTYTAETFNISRQTVSQFDWQQVDNYPDFYEATDERLGGRLVMPTEMYLAFTASSLVEALGHIQFQTDAIETVQRLIGTTDQYSDTELNQIPERIRQLMQGSAQLALEPVVNMHHLSDVLN